MLYGYSGSNLYSKSKVLSSESFVPVIFQNIPQEEEEEQEDVYSVQASPTSTPSGTVPRTLPNPPTPPVIESERLFMTESDRKELTSDITYYVDEGGEVLLTRRNDTHQIVDVHPKYMAMFRLYHGTVQYGFRQPENVRIRRLLFNDACKPEDATVHLRSKTSPSPPPAPRPTITARPTTRSAPTRATTTGTHFILH